MIVESILLSILGNGAYDIIKNLVTNGLGTSDSQIVTKIYKCIDDTIKLFFNEYHNLFGSPEESFLAREENMTLIVKSLYSDSKIDLISQLNRKAYCDNKDVTDEAIEFFVNKLFEVMKGDIELNRMIAEKKHMIETAENQEHIINMLNTLLKDKEKVANTINENGGWVLRDQAGNEQPYAEGAPIKFKFGNYGYIELRIKNNMYFIEVLDDNGNKSYYEVDLDGNVKDLKMPFALSEYSLFFNIEDILHDNIIDLGEGSYRRIIKFKWDRFADVTFDSQDRIQKLHLEGGWIVSHHNRIIKPKD